MYSRITASSRPTVETKYPLAQKWLPHKIAFLLPPYTRAKWIALLPLINPTTCERPRIFGGNRNHHVNVIRPSGDLLRSGFLFAAPALRNTSPRCRPQLPVKCLPAALGNEHNMIFALPLAVGLGPLVLVHRQASFRVRGGSRSEVFGDGPTARKMSKLIAASPAEPGGLPVMLAGPRSARPSFAGGTLPSLPEGNRATENIMGLEKRAAKLRRPPASSQQTNVKVATQPK